MYKCEKCGRSMDYSFRYCPSCGAPAYAALDSTHANPESFLDLFNSLYNLIADRNNYERVIYLPALSEQIIARRCKMGFNNLVTKHSIKLAAS